MQAKDISDESVLAAIERVAKPGSTDGYMGLAPSASRWDIAWQLGGDLPEKVLLAKLRTMVRRGVLEGCTCGCRGDFHILAKEANS